MTARQFTSLAIFLMILNTICGIWNCTDYLGSHNYYIAIFNFIVAAILIIEVSVNGDNPK